MGSSNPVLRGGLPLIKTIGAGRVGAGILELFDIRLDELSSFPLQETTIINSNKTNFIQKSPLSYAGLIGKILVLTHQDFLILNRILNTIQNVSATGMCSM